MDKKQAPMKKLTKIIRDMREFNALALEQQHREELQITPQTFRLALDSAIKALWKEGILFQVTGKGDSTYVRHEGDEQARHAFDQARRRAQSGVRKIARSQKQVALVQTKDKKLREAQARLEDKLGGLAAASHKPRDRSPKSTQG